MPLARDLRPGMRVWINGRGMKIRTVERCTCGQDTCNLIYVYPRDGSARWSEEIIGDWEIREMRRRSEFELVPLSVMQPGDVLRSGVITGVNTDMSGGIRIRLTDQWYGPYLPSAMFSRMRRR